MICQHCGKPLRAKGKHCAPKCVWDKCRADSLHDEILHTIGEHGRVHIERGALDGRLHAEPVER